MIKVAHYTSKCDSKSTYFFITWMVLKDFGT